MTGPTKEFISNFRPAVSIHKILLILDLLGKASSKWCIYDLFGVFNEENFYLKLNTLNVHEDWANMEKEGWD